MILGVEEDRANQALLHEDNPLHTSLAKHTEPIPTNSAQTKSNSFRDPDSGFPKEAEKEYVSLVVRSLDELVRIIGCGIVWKPTTEVFGYLD